MKTRVLVTGGASFIGSPVVDLRLQEGHELAVLDDLSGGRRENIPRGKWRECAGVLNPQKDGYKVSERVDGVRLLPYAKQLLCK